MTTIAKRRSPWDGTDINWPQTGPLFDQQPSINDWLLSQGLGMMSAGAPSFDPAAGDFLGVVGKGAEKASDLMSAGARRDYTRAAGGSARMRQLAWMQAMEAKAKAAAARKAIADRLGEGRGGPVGPLDSGADPYALRGATGGGPGAGVRGPLADMPPELAGLLFEAFPERGAESMLRGSAAKKPQLESFYEGTEEVKKQYDPGTGRWIEQSRGPRWNPKEGGGLTPAQEANNAEIDAAREYVNRVAAGLDDDETLKDEITRRTSAATATGRDNQDYDPLLQKAVTSALNRKVGSDDGYSKFAGQVYGTNRVDQVPTTKEGRPDTAKLKKGAAYSTPKGVLIWTGKAWRRP